MISKIRNQPIVNEEKEEENDGAKQHAHTNTRLTTHIRCNLSNAFELYRVQNTT